MLHKIEHSAPDKARGKRNDIRIKDVHVLPRWFALMTHVALPLVAAFGFSGAATAQGTGSVSSPVIKPVASIGLAAGSAFDDGNEGFAHRLDYRCGVADRWRVSALVVFNDRGGDYRYRRFAVEVMHQFASSEHSWNSAIQVRGRLPDGNDGPGRVRVAWLNGWKPSDGLELRLVGLASKEFGDDRSDGFALETRSEATWKFTPDTRIGAQVFNRYNTTAEFGSFHTQRHSVGGVLKGAWLCENG